jgi:hypothetical protein
MHCRIDEGTCQHRVPAGKKTEKRCLHFAGIASLILSPAGR